MLRSIPGIAPDNLPEAHTGRALFRRTILCDEKVKGTVHLALGNSYPETGGKNESALHWDLIRDLRPGGRLTAGEDIMVDGEFV